MSNNRNYATYDDEIRSFGPYPDLTEDERRRLMECSGSWGKENPDPPPELQRKIERRIETLRARRIANQVDAALVWSVPEVPSEAFCCWE